MIRDSKIRVREKGAGEKKRRSKGEKERWRFGMEQEKRESFSQVIKQRIVQIVNDVQYGIAAGRGIREYMDSEQLRDYDSRVECPRIRLSKYEFATIRALSRAFRETEYEEIRNRYRILRVALLWMNVVAGVGLLLLVLMML